MKGFSGLVGSWGLLWSWFLLGCAWGQGPDSTESAPLRERLARNLLRNGDFEQGLDGWSTAHGWYARGDGLSAWAVDETVAHSGQRSVKVSGQNNRGIALQDVRPPLPVCTVSGWLRGENLSGQAQILVEFIAPDGQWLSGVPVGSVTGTSDWTFVQQEVEMPPEAGVLRVDLLTTEPNTGVAWFDNVSVRVHLPPDDGRPPTAPSFRVKAVAGEEGALAVEWPPTADPDTMAFQIFIEPAPFRDTAALAPRAVVRRNVRSYTHRNLSVGQRYWVAVAAVDVGGRVSSVRPRLKQAVDARPPEAVPVDIEPVGGHPPRARLHWEPHPVDDDVAGFEVVRRRGEEIETLRKLPRSERETTVALGGETETLSVVAFDRSGNRSQPQWQTVVAEGPNRLDAGFEAGQQVQLLNPRGPAMLATEGWAPTRLPENLQALLETSPLALAKEGVMLSRPLVRPPDRRWGRVFYRAQVPTKTALRVDVLGPGGQVLQSEVASGADLSGLSSPVLRLRATLQGDGAQSPELEAWGLTLEPGPAETPFSGGVLDALTGQPVPQAIVTLHQDKAVRRVRTDAQGRFTFPASSEGLAQVRVTAGKYLDYSRWVYLAKEGSGLVLPLYPQREAQLRTGFTSSLTHVFRDAEPQETETWALHAARGETEAVQFVLKSERDWAWARVRWPEEADPLFEVRSRFVGYVPLRAHSRATPPEELVRQAPGDFPDPLLDRPFVPLRANEAQPIFITVRPRPGVRPGTYRLPLRVEWPVGELTRWLEVRVYAVDFPPQTRLWFTNWFNASHFARYHGVPEWGNEHFRWMRLYARLMREQHQNVLLVPLSLVQVFQRPDGRFRFDFERFDRFVATFEAEGAAERLELSHLGGRKTGRWEDPEFVASPQWATHEQTGEQVEVPLETFLQGVRDHLKATGRLSRSMLHIADEPIPVNVESWKTLSERVHQAVPDLPRVDAIHVPNLEGHLEVWVPQLNYFAQWLDTYRQRQREGNEIWFYTAWVPQDKWPNRLIDLPLIKTRILHWMNVRYGATGFLHWGWNHWGDVMTGDLQSPGDAFIVYPGPAASLRFEAQRDGIEDAELLWLAAEVAGRLAGGNPLTPEKAAALVEPWTGRVVRDFTDFTREPAALEEVRREVLRVTAKTSWQELKENTRHDP